MNARALAMACVKRHSRSYPSGVRVGEGNGFEEAEEAEEAMTRLILGIGVAVLVALGVGWAWGASGKADITRALRVAELQNGLLKGRAAVLDARLDIYSVNFGDASRHFEAALDALRASEARLNDLGRQEDAKRLTNAVARIDEAQRKAGQLNQDANALAADAAKTINEVLGSAATR